jgi:ubiquinone/menaquinone biosynthesis C-methylase UbiE
MAQKEDNMESTKRFSNRVENYVKYRPSYPIEMINFLLEKGIRHNSTVCDIGAGTGILSKLLINKVGKLYAIEPNENMRLYADKSLSNYENYQSLLHTAEDTKLNDSSVDAITVAQAFHWFDQDKCKKEFKRILKPNGLIFLIWNNRINNTLFLQGYDDLLYKYGTDYSTVNHQNITDDALKNFIDENFEKTIFNNFQDFNLEGFLGRVFSSSYTPTEDQPNYEIFLSELKNLFKKYHESGIVRFNYKTEIFSGNMIK